MAKSLLARLKIKLSNGKGARLPCPHSAPMQEAGGYEKKSEPIVANEAAIIGITKETETGTAETTPPGHDLVPTLYSQQALYV